MRTGARAASLAAITVLAGACFLGSPASAGGSGWEFDREFYVPGDRVVAGAAVAWAHNEALGTPDDGPYGVWIAPYDENVESVVPLAEQVEQARYVTDVRIEVGGGVINGVRFGPNVAWAEFTLPDVAPGFYSLLHCNYPCTTRLGDVLFGTFWVGPPDPSGIPTPAPPPTTTTPPVPTTTTTAARATTLSDSPVSPPESGGNTVPIVAGAVVLALAAGAVVIVRRRHRHQV